MSRASSVAVDNVPREAPSDADVRSADAEPPLTLLLEADGSATAVNDAWCRATGMTSGCSAGPGWLTAVDQGERARLLTAVRLTASGGIASCSLDVRVRGRTCGWRLSEHEGQVVAVVTRVLDPDAGVRDPASTAAGLARWLMPDLFAVSMDLAGSLGDLGDPSSRRLERVIERLDRIIEDVRTATRG